MQYVQKSLLCLHDGECGTISSMDSCGELKRRLMDIGFIEGTKIKRLHSSPCGNPVAYLVRGTVIALRNSDSQNILLK